MQDPTFKLEGIVRTKSETEDFEGPLTLILQLLSKNKIEIKDIRISLILEQYLAYLDEMKAMDLEVASEFVAMASHLVYIKARMLVEAQEEVTELQELISSLESLQNRDVYAAIKGISCAFTDIYRAAGSSFVRQAEQDPGAGEYRYVHEPEDILAAIRRVFERSEAPAPQEQKSVPMPTRIVYSVSKKAGEILSRLRSMGAMQVSDLLNMSRSRSELVATSVAILELCRDGSAELTGEDDGMLLSGRTQKNASGGEEIGNT